LPRLPSVGPREPPLGAEPGDWDALDRLHATSTHECGRNRRLEAEIVDVQATLTRVRAELVVRPGIGMATCPADGGTAGALLGSADASMHRAKRRRMDYGF
jgi:GGDEF domain-containing protein